MKRDRGYPGRLPHMIDSAGCDGTRRALYWLADRWGLYKAKSHSENTGWLFHLREESILLEKWQCHKCEIGFLLIAEETKDKKVHCPFCGSKEHAEAVTWQNPEVDYESEMGCLWPGYNKLDKLAHQMRVGQISHSEGIEYLTTRFRGKRI